MTALFVALSGRKDSSGFYLFVAHERYGLRSHSKERALWVFL